MRELENAVKRALVLSSSEILGVEDFEFLQPAGSSGSSAGTLPELVEQEVTEALSSGAPDVYRSVMDRVERPLLTAVLTRTDGNQIRAASLLGINRNTLRKKIADLGIRIPGRE